MAIFYLLYLSFSYSFLAGRSNSHNASNKRRSIHKQITFDSTKFKLKYVLGSGSFGVVTYAEYFDENCDINNGSYALKSISKADVVETGEYFQGACFSIQSCNLYQMLSIFFYSISCRHSSFLLFFFSSFLRS